MMRRFRLRVGLFLCIGLLVAGWTLAAYATSPVTRSEMESFVYLTLGGAAVLVLGGGAGLMKLVMSSERKHQEENLKLRFEAVHTKLDDFAEDCSRHRCGLGPRDPRESPRTKRENDSSEFDRTGMPWRERRGRGANRARLNGEGGE